MYAALNTQTAFLLPIQTAQTYFKSHKNTPANATNTQNTASANALLVMLQGVNTSLLDIQNSFLDLNKTAAMPLVSVIQPLQPLVADMQTQIIVLQKQATNKIDRLILNEFDSILKNIVILFDDINEISNDEIDEDSPEFEAVLVDYFYHSLQDEIKANGGKRAAHTQKDIDTLFD
jgi:hypothetical protein